MSNIKTQKGATLFIGLMLLLAISIMSLAAMRTSVLDLIIANNNQQFAYTFEASEEIAEQRMSNMIFPLPAIPVSGTIINGTTNNNEIISKTVAGDVKTADVKSEVFYRTRGTAPGWDLTARSYHFNLDVEAKAPGRGAAANHRVGFYVIGAR